MKKYLPVVLLIVGLGVGFAGGFYFKGYQQNKLRANFANVNANGQRFVPNAAMRDSGAPRGNFASGIDGDIISVDEKSVTVKLSDGSTKIIFFSENTSYLISTIAKKEDLKTVIARTSFSYFFGIIL